MKMEWQPIETAPKDGTVVMGFDEKLPTRGLSPPIACIRWFDTAWWGTTGDSIVMLRPTHWMPLPDAPSQEASNE